MSKPREAHIARESAETRIELTLRLDGSGQCSCRTGFGMFDHMLHLIAFWGGMDLTVACEGDLHVDAHHTVEDVGMVFGQALLGSLGARQGINRVGYGRVPMDEALAESTVDFSGRPWLVWRGDELLPPVIAREEKDIWREFYKSLATHARMNLHISFLYGKNGHHLLESAAKSTGLAICSGATVNGTAIRSTKGGLD